MHQESEKPHHHDHDHHGHGHDHHGHGHDHHGHGHDHHGHSHEKQTGAKIEQGRILTKFCGILIKKNSINFQIPSHCGSTHWAQLC
jgi:hypothetical protein